jgi:hypothetical protein
MERLKCKVLASPETSRLEQELMMTLDDMAEVFCRVLLMLKEKNIVTISGLPHADQFKVKAGQVLQLIEGFADDAMVENTYLVLRDITSTEWEDLVMTCWRKAAWTFQAQPTILQWTSKTEELIPQELLARGWAIVHECVEISLFDLTTNFRMLIGDE